jgi:hypothetical protein
MPAPAPRRRPWNVGRTLKNLLRTVLIRLFCPAGRDDAAAIESLAQFKPLFEGKTVALVGNAQSLFGSGLGEEIESCAVVARMNFGSIRSEIDQGARTDALFFATKMSRSAAKRLFRCDRFIWAYARRDRIALGFLLHPQSLAFVPVQDFHRLEAVLGARPSTGLVALDLLLNRLGAAEVRLYGFDWKDTKTFYEQRLLKNVHAWEKERDLILKWSRESRGDIVVRPSLGAS